jgi:hypothetical protein
MFPSFVLGTQVLQAFFLVSLIKVPQHRSSKMPTAEELLEKHTTQGALVRTLKAEKGGDHPDVAAALEQLLRIKQEYKVWGTHTLTHVCVPTHVEFGVCVCVCVCVCVFMALTCLLPSSPRAAPAGPHW